MRLINTKTLHLDEFHGSVVPSYAILSHTWTVSELNLQDWLYAHGQNPPRWGWVHLEAEVAKVKAAEGYRKVVQACNAALKDGLAWLWADTVCIDKTSSAELSEAINSMYDWYSLAGVCYAFLEDVPPSTAEECSQEGSRFRASRWFRRGWTLQELLAPPNLQFISSSWTPIGSREDVSDVINQITGIPPRPVFRPHWWQPVSRPHRWQPVFWSHRWQPGLLGVSQVMAWACERQTTREEDAAYCLMGLFGVNMPLLYGEKRRAFRRLQLELLQTTADWTVLTWDRAQCLTRKTGREDWALELVETLAVEPGDFRYSYGDHVLELVPKAQREASLRISNLGLELRLPLVKTPCTLLWFAVLPLDRGLRSLWMPLWGDRERGFRRIAFPSITFSVRCAGYLPTAADISLPIYTELDFFPELPRLHRPPVRLGRVSPVSILFASWTSAAPMWQIKKIPSENSMGLAATSRHRLDSAILRLQFDNIVKRVAYGAIEVTTGFVRDSRCLFFAVEFESTDSLRPSRWMCSSLGCPRAGRSLEEEARRKVRDISGSGLERAEFPLDCRFGDWDVSLDHCAYDPSTKEYVRSCARPGLPEPVDHTSDKRDEEIFIVAQFGKRGPGI